MKWLIRWSREAASDLDHLDPEVGERVMSAITLLAVEGIGDVRRLVGIDPPEYRLRVGKWRVRFSFDHAQETLYVLHIRRRDEAY